MIVIEEFSLVTKCCVARRYDNDNIFFDYIIFFDEASSIGMER